MGNPRITVIFLLYHAEKTVPELLRALLQQRHPAFKNQGDWMEAIFVDDCSKDHTVEMLREELGKAGSPAHIRINAHPKNLGLSRTLNESFAEARSPYVLTCHCDCIFGREDYVSSMLELMEKTPDAGSITGQPQVWPRETIPVAEKVNLITNLMDIFPAPTQTGLVSVGFAEGRCDVFRMSAMKAVGFYDTTLRLAGEDQVIAAKMRANGFQVYQAPGLPYFLGVSDEQDTLGKLIRHQRLYGRAHPYILLKTRGTHAGVVGGQAGANRQSRTLLRALQVASTAVYLLAALEIVLGFSPWVALGMVLAVFLAKALIFWKHLRQVGVGFTDLLVLFGMQPLLDISYTAGLIQGFWLLARGSESRPIS